MSLIRRAGRNIAFKALGEASRLAWAVFLILVARRLGSEALGRISFAYSFTYIFVLLADLGLTVLIVREVAREKALAGRYLGNLLSIKVVSLPFTFALIAGAILVSGYPPDVVTVVLLFAGINLARAILEVYGAVFSGLEVMGREAVLKNLHQLALLGAGVIALALGSGVTGLAVALLIGSLLAVALGSGLVWQVVPLFRPLWDRTLWLTLARRAVPVGVTVMCIVLYNESDIVLLSYLGQGEVEIGWYAAASKVMKMLQLLPMLVVTAVYPVFADLARGPKAEFSTAYRGTLKLLLVIGIPVAVLVAGLAEPLMRVVYGVEFLPGAAPLRLLACSVPFLYLGYVLVNVLVASDRTRSAALATGGAAAITLAANLLLIPALGITGAALAAVTGQVGLVVLGAAAVRRAGAGSRWIQLVSKPAAAGAAMLLAVAWVSRTSWALALPVGAAVYLLVLAAIGALREEEFMAVRRLWRRAERYGALNR
jgi:O-antigen/teichoic acid export membrane protein